MFYPNEAIQIINHKRHGDGGTGRDKGTFLKAVLPLTKVELQCAKSGLVAIVALGVANSSGRRIAGDGVDRKRVVGRLFDDRPDIAVGQVHARGHSTLGFGRFEPDHD